MKIISVTDYASRRGITRQAVLKRIKGNLELLGVIKAEKVGSTYMLTVDEKKIKKTSP